MVTKKLTNLLLPVRTVESCMDNNLFTCLNEGVKLMVKRHCGGKMFTGDRDRAGKIHIQLKQMFYHRYI